MVYQFLWISWIVPIADGKLDLGVPSKIPTKSIKLDHFIHISVLNFFSGDRSQTVRKPNIEEGKKNTLMYTFTTESMKIFYVRRR